MNGTYSKVYNTHTFAGMAPYSNPKVVFMITWLNKTNNTGDAGTVIKSIVKSSLNKLNSSSKKVKTFSYKLPNFMNQSITYAKSTLSQNGLSPIVIGNGSTVIGQYPESGTTITNSTRVMLATNGNKIEMPSMIGWSRKDAEAFGALAGVNITTVGAGTIYKQSVAKGTTLKSKQTIKVYAK
jgi:penicillin-binding protein 2B